jgi:hypothetical protein
MNRSKIPEGIPSDPCVREHADETQIDAVASEGMPAWEFLKNRRVYPNAPTPLPSSSAMKSTNARIRLDIWCRCE